MVGYCSKKVQNFEEDRFSFYAPPKTIRRTKMSIHLYLIAIGLSFTEFLARPCYVSGLNMKASRVCPVDFLIFQN